MALNKDLIDLYAEQLVEATVNDHAILVWWPAWLSARSVNLGKDPLSFARFAAEMGEHADEFFRSISVLSGDQLFDEICPVCYGSGCPRSFVRNQLPDAIAMEEKLVG